ncbi:hypothetical protein [Stackebrandtia nassauensis]|uniref:hypothetical protein n=1 Tax=Stackebrandtia nassauensis TaxID=283811 RepID=UPI0001A395E0|nr:hypothetical protein [Stackebrandtia nassauensis]
MTTAAVPPAVRWGWVADGGDVVTVPVLLSARLVPWLRAWRAGMTSLDDVVEAMTSEGMSGVEQIVVTEAEIGPGATLTEGFSRLSGVDTEDIRLVLAVPGDARGLPTAGPFAAAALTAGEAVVAGRNGLVPERRAHTSGSGSTWETVLWHHFELDAVPVPADLVSPGEADASLTQALRAATKVLSDLDVAAWNPELGRALAGARTDSGRQLPPGFDTRSRRLYARAVMLERVLRVADSDAMGGAVTAHEAAARLEALRGLAASCRTAIGAACHARLHCGDR